MGTIIIFWSAVMALIFYLLCVVFRVAAAVIQGGITAITNAIAGGILVGFGAFLIDLLYQIIVSIMQGDFWEKLILILVFLFIISIIISLFLWFGVIIINFVVLVIYYVITVATFLVVGAGEICEMVYGFFLNTIMKQVSKC